MPRCSRHTQCLCARCVTMGQCAKARTWKLSNGHQASMAMLWDAGSDGVGVSVGRSGPAPSVADLRSTCAQSPAAELAANAASLQRQVHELCLEHLLTPEVYTCRLVAGGLQGSLALCCFASTGQQMRAKYQWEARQQPCSTRSPRSAPGLLILCRPRQRCGAPLIWRHVSLSLRPRRRCSQRRRPAEQEWRDLSTRFAQM